MNAEGLCDYVNTCQVAILLLHLLVQVSNVDLHRLLQVSDRQVAHTACHHIAVEGVSTLLLLKETRRQLWVVSAHVGVVY